VGWSREPDPEHYWLNKNSYPIDHELGPGHKADASLVRKTTSAGNVCGTPERCSTFVFLLRADGRIGQKPAVMGVSTIPGHIVFTRILGANSSARTLSEHQEAPFDAA